MTSRRELTDAFVIKWEFDQDLWGVALEFANGDRHNYCVGSYKEATREMLRVLKQCESNQTPGLIVTNLPQRRR